jgi:hypothetical protein
MKGVEERITGAQNREYQIKAQAIKDSILKKKTSTVKPSETEELADTKDTWRNWGDSNDFPSEYWLKLETSALPQRIIEDLCRIHFGNGIYFGKEQVVDNVIVRIPKIDKEVSDFMQRNQMQIQYGTTLIRDMYLWKMSPVEFIADTVAHKIIKVKVHDATMVRWGDKNEAGVIDKAYLSANWPIPTDKQYAVLPVVDPLNPEESIEANKSKTNFIYPVMNLTPTHMYYPRAAWTSEDIMNWLVVSCLTPVFHQSLLENILVTPTIIYIHEDFWSQRYPDWDDKPNEKKARKKETFDTIEGALSGASKAGKFITGGYTYDDHGNEIKGIKIEAVKQEIPDKAFIYTNAQADSEFSFALGYDPSLMGQGMPGGKELSGSGSEKMRSLQNRQILMALDRVVTLQFLNFVARYNKWDGEFFFMDNTPTTLDENKDGLKKDKNIEDAD